MARRSTPQSDAGPIRPRALIGLLLMWAGSLLSGFGICRTATRQWPEVWLAMVRTGGGLSDRQVRAVRAMLETVPEARRALLLAELAARFTRAWRGPDDPAALLRDIQRRTSGEPLASMPTARLYEAAACLLLAERRPDQRPAALNRVRAIVMQLEATPLPHHMDAATWALASSLLSAVLQYTGGTIRDAERLALIELGQPHGPLVEYLAPRLGRLALDLDAGGDRTMAAAVRRLVYHWLSSWLRDPGPPALRVLSADVLADLLEADPAFGASPELIRDLRELRRSYREDVERNAPPPERIPGSPQWRQRAARKLIAQIGQAVWIAAVAALAGLIGMLATLYALARRAPHPSRAALRRNTNLAAGCALLLWLAGWGVFSAGWIQLPDALPDAAAARKAMTPAALWAAAATLLMTTFWFAALRRPRPARLAHGMLWLAITAGVLFQMSGLRLARGWGGPASVTAGVHESLLAVLPGPRSSQIIKSLPQRLPLR